MKLSQWAKEQGLTYKGAWRMWKAGQLPVPAEQLPTGTIIVKEVKKPLDAVGLYARVSSSDQRREVEAQLGRLVLYAQHHGWTIVEAVSEVGSGLNGHRPKLSKLLGNANLQAIVVEHRDRLLRFGAEYVEAALAAQGRRLIVVESAEVKDDLVQDMLEVLTSFCARLYGRRSARHRAQKAVQAIHQGRTTH
jgi:putative resolvase